jgi:integration host factor subunit beta
MTKSDLVRAFAAKTHIPITHAEAIINLIFDGLADAMKRGERIEIRGFGSFRVREYKGYQARDPKTEERVEVNPKKMALFRVGKELRERVDGRAT